MPISQQVTIFLMLMFKARLNDFDLAQFTVVF